VSSLLYLLLELLTCPVYWMMYGITQLTRVGQEKIIRLSRLAQEEIESHCL